MLSVNSECGYESKRARFARSPLGRVLSKVGTSTAAVIGALIALGEEERLTVSNTAKAALATAVSAFAGTFLGGAPGLAVGFALGTAFAYRKMRNSQTLKEVLESMTPEQKQELSSNLMTALKNTDIADLTPEKLPSLITRQDIREIVIKILMNFLAHKMGLKLNR